MLLGFATLVPFGRMIRVWRIEPGTNFQQHLVEFRRRMNAFRVARRSNIEAEQVGEEAYVYRDGNTEQFVSSDSSTGDGRRVSHSRTKSTWYQDSPSLNESLSR